MTKQQPSFTQNINYLARNIHLLERGRELLTPSAVHALESLIKMPLEDIAADVKKGVTDKGKRKLDIQPSLNSKRDESWVLYDGITIYGADDKISHRIAFTPVFRAQDIAHQLHAAIQNYNTQVNSAEFEIKHLDIDLVTPDQPDMGYHWLLRLTDADTEYTTLGAVVLHVTSDSLMYAKEKDVHYSWFKSTSAILQMASTEALVMRALAITLRVAEEVRADAIVAEQAASAANQSAVEAHSSADLADYYSQSASAAAQASEASRQASAAEALESHASAAQALASADRSEASAVRAAESAISTEAAQELITELIDTMGAQVIQAVAASTRADSNATTALDKATIAEDTANAIGGTADLALITAADALALIEEVTGKDPMGPITWHIQETLRNTIIPDNMNAASYGPVLVIGDTFATTVGENSAWTIL